MGRQREAITSLQPQPNNQLLI